MTVEVPPIDGCCAKEPYAFFGMAAYWAQVLEHSALNLAVVLRLPEVDALSQELFEEVYATLGDRTFGQLLRAAGNKLHISPGDRNLLREALDTRNFLVHRYFRERAEDFVSEQGRREMMKELQQITAKLKVADGVLERLYMPLWEKYGVNDAFIERELAKLRAEVERRDKAEGAG